MKTLLLFICIALTAQVFAQDQTVKGLQDESTSKAIAKDANDTLKRTWKVGSLLGFNLSQASLSNWAAGGDNFALSFNAFINAHAYYKKGRNSWDNILDVNLGYLKTTSIGARKTDDRIDLLSKYGYALNPKLNLSGLFNFRSQFFKGYNYNSDGTKIYSSNFLAPAYVLVSAGLDYHPAKGLSIFASPITTRWLIVNDDSLSAQAAYGVDTGRKSKNEIGAFVTVNYTTPLNKIVSYTGRVDLFSNYKHNPQNIDFYMTNMFVAKLSKVLSATWSLDLIYDDDVKLFGKNNNSAAMQLKSLIGVGLLVKL